MKTGQDGQVGAGGADQVSPRKQRRGERVCHKRRKNNSTQQIFTFLLFPPPSFLPPSEVSLAGHSLRWEGCGRDQQFLVVVSAPAETDWRQIKPVASIHWHYMLITGCRELDVLLQP